MVDKLAYQRHRQSMQRNYYCVWKTFNEFYIKLDVKPKSWEDRIILFVGHLVQRKFQSSSIKSYISGIKAVLRQDGIEINEDKYLLTSLTRACKLINDCVRTRLPIRKPLLHTMLRRMEELFDNQPYLKCLYQALFSTAYFGLFRIGEITMSPHVVKARDTHIAVNKNKMMFVLFTSKTHGHNVKPQMIKISSQKVEEALKGSNVTHQWCPFMLLQRFLKIRNNSVTEQEQFFVFSDNSPVLPSHMRIVLKNLIFSLGLDADLYTVQGFRSGRASDLVDLKIPVSVVRNLGRWKSNAIYTYLKY